VIPEAARVADVVLRNSGSAFGHEFLRSTQSCISRNSGDDKEGCDTPAPLGGASKRASTGAAPAAKRSSNFLFSKE
jgi:hypothetical protein